MNFQLYFYFKAVKLHLASHAIYDKINRQMKHIQTYTYRWGWGTVYTVHLGGILYFVFYTISPFPKKYEEPQRKYHFGSNIITPLFQYGVT